MYIVRSGVVNYKAHPFQLSSIFPLLSTDENIPCISHLNCTTSCLISNRNFVCVRVSEIAISVAITFVPYRCSIVSLLLTQAAVTRTTVEIHLPTHSHMHSSVRTGVGDSLCELRMLSYCNFIWNHIVACESRCI